MVGQVARGRGEHQGGAGVGEHVCDAVRGLVEVDRQVGGTGLQHGQQRDDGLRGAGDRERHDVLGADPAGQQQVREAVRAHVEFGEGECGLPEHERGRFRSLRGAPGEGLGQCRRRVLDGGVVPVVQDPVPFDVGQQVDPGHRAVRVGDEPVEDPHQPVEHGGRGGLVEEVLAVVEAQRDGVAGDHRQQERIVCRVPPFDGGDAEVLDVQFGLPGELPERVVLEHDDRVEQLPAVACGGLDVDQPVELVVQCPAEVLLDPRYQLRGGFPGVQHDAGGDRVDEQPDDVLRCGDAVGATGDGHPEHHVVSAEQGRQHHAPRGLDDDAEGDSVASGEVPKPARCGHGQLPCHRAGQLAGVDPAIADQTGLDTAQPLGPEPPSAAAQTEHVAHQGAEIGCLLQVFTAVQREQFPQQHRNRPAVPEHVVMGHHESEGVLRRSHQHEPCQRSGGHVETARTLPLDQSPKFRVGVARIAQVDDLERRGHPPLDDLDPLP